MSTFMVEYNTNTGGTYYPAECVCNGCSQAAWIWERGEWVRCPDAWKTPDPNVCSMHRDDLDEYEQHAAEMAEMRSVAIGRNRLKGEHHVSTDNTPRR